MQCFDPFVYKIIIINSLQNLSIKYQEFIDAMCIYDKINLK
jgi:hypothetical protein